MLFTPQEPKATPNCRLITRTPDPSATSQLQMHAGCTGPRQNPCAPLLRCPTRWHWRGTTEKEALLQLRERTGLCDPIANPTPCWSEPSHGPLNMTPEPRRTAAHTSNLTAHRRALPFAHSWPVPDLAKAATSALSSRLRYPLAPRRSLQTCPPGDSRSALEATLPRSLTITLTRAQHDFWQTSL